MIFIALLSLLVFPIIFLLNLTPNINQIITGLSFTIASIVTILSMFLPKIIQLMHGHDIDSNLGVSKAKVVPKLANLNNLNNKNHKNNHSNRHPMITNTMTAGQLSNGMTSSRSNALSTDGQELLHNRNITIDEKVKICFEQINLWQSILLQLNDNSNQSGSSPSRYSDPSVGNNGMSTFDPAGGYTNRNLPSTVSNKIRESNNNLSEIENRYKMIGTGSGTTGIIGINEFGVLSSTLRDKDSEKSIRYSARKSIDFSARIDYNNNPNNNNNNNNNTNNNNNINNNNNNNNNLNNINSSKIYNNNNNNNNEQQSIPLFFDDNSMPTTSRFHGLGNGNGGDTTRSNKIDENTIYNNNFNINNNNNNSPNMNNKYGSHQSVIITSAINDETVNRLSPGTSISRNISIHANPGAAYVVNTNDEESLIDSNNNNNNSNNNNSNNNTNNSNYITKTNSNNNDLTNLNSNSLLFTNDFMISPKIKRLQSLIEENENYAYNESSCLVEEI